MINLLKKSARDVVGLGWRALAIALITAVGIMVFTGGFNSRDTLAHTRDFYYDSLKLADLDVYFTAATEDEMPKVNIPGVKSVKRFIYQTTLDMQGKEPLSLVLIHQRMSDRLPVNDLKLIEGKPLKNGDKEGILLDRTFARIHGFKVGDKLGLRSLGFPVQLTIRGTVVTPEYLVPMGSPYVLIPIKGSLGVAFATLDRIEEVFGYPMYNNLSFLYDGREADKKGVVLKEFKALKIGRTSVKKDQFSYKWLEQDLKGFKIFVPAMVFVFGVVVCVVTIMVFNRLIQSRRREIGVLMALGYRRRAIFLSFLASSLSLGLLGSIIGLALSPLFTWLLAGSVGFYLDMPELRYVYPFEYSLEGFLIGVFLSLFSSTLPLLEIFRVAPQEAIRSTESRGNLARLLDFTKYFDFRSLQLKYSTRNLLRRPGLSLATVSLVTLAISICTAFYSSTQSWDFYAEKAIGQEKWDIVSIFRVNLSPEEAAKVWDKKEITDVRPFYAEAVVVKAKGTDRDFVVQSSDDLRDVVHLEYTEGSYFTSDDAFEVLFSKVDHLPVKTGDGVIISLDGSEYKFKVAGILNRMTTGIAYIPIGTAKRVKNNKIRGFYANTRLRPAEAKKVIYTSENVAWVQPKTDIKKAVLEFLSEATVVTKVALWISIALAMLFLLMGVTLNIRDREGEYATLSSLGFPNKFLTLLILSETAMEGMMALILSVPVSYFFAKYLNYKMGEAWIKMDMYFEAKELIEVMIYALAFLPIAALPGIRHIIKLDIPTAVRRKSFG